MQFNDLQLISPILKAVEKEGYTQPTPIQIQAIPPILAKKDVWGCAQTGTGKTAAFAIPMLQLLTQPLLTQSRKRPIRSLILTPTRELAIQIGESFQTYGQFLSIRHTTIFGGVGKPAQIDALRHGVDVLVATPGRLLDFMNQGVISLQHIEFFVLDEADRMLDMGFIHDVKRILTQLPKERQTLFFSATMSVPIQELAAGILRNPVKVEVTPIATTAETIQQSVFFVNKEDKISLLQFILKDKKIETVLVFTRTKHGADKVVRILNSSGERAEAIHSNKSQNARQRALHNFKTRYTRVLVATDIAARGIDIDSLGFVINFDIPNESETYVHRIGRTGRAGASGIAYSFCDSEERAYLKDIEKLINKKFDIVQSHPFPSAAVQERPAILLPNKQLLPASSAQRPKKKKPFYRNR
jgi:ATP-dependent RNA helicase RhlE